MAHLGRGLRDDAVQSPQGETLRSPRREPWDVRAIRNNKSPGRAKLFVAHGVSRGTRARRETTIALKGRHTIRAFLVSPLAGLAGFIDPRGLRAYALSYKTVALAGCDPNRTGAPGRLGKIGARSEP